MTDVEHHEAIPVRLRAVEAVMVAMLLLLTPAVILVVDASRPDITVYESGSLASILAIVLAVLALAVIVWMMLRWARIKRGNMPLSWADVVPSIILGGIATLLTVAVALGVAIVVAVIADDHDVLVATLYVALAVVTALAVLAGARLERTARRLRQCEAQLSNTQDIPQDNTEPVDNASPEDQ